MKKERPILFNTDMVQAIEKGRKNQTIRTKGLEGINLNPHEWIFEHVDDFFNFRNTKDTSMCMAVKCPYGEPGDILWVRETFGIDFMEFSNNQKIIHYSYKANKIDERPPDGWKPSIHMPKSACRFKLEIVSLSVERLWNITEVDAIDEGILIQGSTTKGAGFSVTNIFYVDYMDLGGKAYANPINSFLSLWESINGEKSMNSNPWVWRIEFKVVKHVLA